LYDCISKIVEQLAINKDRVYFVTSGTSSKTMTFVDEKLIKCVIERLTQIRIDSGTSLAEGLKQGFNILKTNF
jgi:hypothetical protein